MGAIRVENQHAVIDQTKCISCGKCMTLCPFHAITKTAVPCEDACPVGAIKKNSEGIAEIDFDKCIFCGKCFSNCPFSAIMERSELMNDPNEIKKGKEVVAIIAPSAQESVPRDRRAAFLGCCEDRFQGCDRGCARCGNDHGA